VRKKEVDLVIKSSDIKEGRIQGYAARFGNVDRHGDILMPGSLKKSGKVPLLWNHDANQVIGSVYITEDDQGYRYDGTIAINSENEDIRRRANWVYTLIEEGHVNWNSFGFVVEDGKWSTRTVDGKKRQVFMITKADVAEVSIVPMPANPAAGVTSIKSYEVHQPKQEEPKPQSIQNISDAILWGYFL
jgi:uncharacterized protein